MSTYNKNKVGMAKNAILLLSFFAAFGQQTYAQIALGQWRDFYSHKKIIDFAIGSDYAFFASPNALFRLAENGETRRFSKTKSLNDVGISCIGIEPNSQILVVAYESSIIDLLQGDKVETIRSVYEQNDQSIRVHQLCFANGFAYLATSFGIVKVNVAKHEIAETYYIGNAGEKTSVISICYSSFYNSLFALTENRLLQGRLDGINLMDFASWEEIPSSGLSRVAASGQYVYGQTGLLGIVRWDGQSWENNNLPFETVIDMRPVGESILISDNVYSYGIDAAGNWTKLAPLGDSKWASSSFKENSFSVSSNNGVYYIDKELMIDENVSDSFSSIISNNRILYAASSELSIFDTDNKWQNIDSGNIFKKLTIKPDGKLWLLHENGSLYQLEQDGLQQKKIAQGTDIAFDNSGKLWLANQSADYRLAYSTDGEEWNNIKDIALSNLQFSELTPLSNGDVWMLSAGQIYTVRHDVYNNTTTTNKFYAYDDKGLLLSRQLTCLAQAADGSVWCGSKSGVLNFSNPALAFYDLGKPAAHFVVADNGDEAAYLLSDTNITEIAVDGGNQKWIGTANSGVYLVAANNNVIQAHYTRENSPLPSNNIQQISIDNLSGEVFILTDVGLVSFRGKATTGSTNFGHAYAFPNPVRPAYAGPITISGLMEETHVKITDAAGNLVREMKSTGGQAQWDGKTRQGKRAATGIYFAFLTNPEASEKGVVKILFIH